jgi:hypothetical protein
MTVDTSSISSLSRELDVSRTRLLQERQSLDVLDLSRQFQLLHI